MEKLVNEILKININSSIQLEKFKDLKSSVISNGDKSRDFCPYCGVETTFEHSSIMAQKGEMAWSYIPNINDKKGLIVFNKAICSMSDEHILIYGYQIDDKSIFKFAEYPFDIIKMKVPMPKGKLLRELELDTLLMKAYSSAQSNLNLGSYIYARRVLEGVVNHIAKENSLLDDNWTSKTLGNKIDAIKSHLPIWVKNNIARLSAVLGDSLHNWTEEQAKQNYNIIIEIIKLSIEKIEAEIEERKIEKTLELELAKIK